MSQLVLRELTSKDEQAFLNGLRDWHGEELSWYTFVWKPGMSFAEHLQLLNDQKDKNIIPKDRVPSSMLYAFVGQKIVGRLSIRHELNDYLIERGGHIGYAVSPLERKKGYATEIMKQGIEFCKKLGLKKILITCSDKNEASWKVIEKFNAQLENKFFDSSKNEEVRRYWLDLTW